MDEDEIYESVKADLVAIHEAQARDIIRIVRATIREHEKEIAHAILARRAQRAQ